MSFSQTQMTPPGQAIGGAPINPALAAALMAQHAPNLGLSTPSTGIPLASLMDLMKGQQQGQQKQPPLPIWNPNNPIGTEKLTPDTANQGSWLGNALATFLSGSQQRGASAMPAASGLGAGVY